MSTPFVIGVLWARARGERACVIVSSPHPVKTSSATNLARGLRTAHLLPFRAQHHRDHACAHGCGVHLHNRHQSPVVVKRLRSHPLLGDRALRIAGHGSPPSHRAAARLRGTARTEAFLRYIGPRYRRASAWLQ